VGSTATKVAAKLVPHTWGGVTQGMWGSGETRVTSHESVQSGRRTLLAKPAAAGTGTNLKLKKKVALSGHEGKKKSLGAHLSRHTHHTSWGLDLGQLGTGSGPTVGSQALQCRHNSKLSDDSVLRNVPSMGHYAPWSACACVEFRGAWISKPGASKWMGTYIITMACNGHVPFRNSHVTQVRLGISKGNHPL
jgi:hypothetical protein